MESRSEEESAVAKVEEGAGGEKVGDQPGEGGLLKTEVVKRERGTTEDVKPDIKRMKLER